MIQIMNTEQIIHQIQWALRFRKTLTKATQVERAILRYKYQLLKTNEISLIEVKLMKQQFVNSCPQVDELWTLTRKLNWITVQKVLRLLLHLPHSNHLFLNQNAILTNQKLEQFYILSKNNQYLKSNSG